MQKQTKEFYQHKLSPHKNSAFHNEEFYSTNTNLNYEKKPE